MSAAATDSKVYVTRTSNVCGGKPCIAGTRISVNLIAELTQGGETPDDIVAQMPHLSLAEVHGALAYYYDHRDDIDQSIVEGIKFVEEMRRKTGPGPYEAWLMEKNNNAPLSP